jgi:hypothetical protein
MVGANVCADTLAAITQREVAEGRMAPDHELYVMAHQQVALPHRSRAELVALAAQKDAPQPKAGGWRRMSGLGRRS